MAFQQSGIDGFVNSFLSPVTFWNQFRVNLLFIGISFAFWYARRNYISEKNQQILEREIINARLQSLKNQINPHFLYNTLSFIYAKSLPHSPELSAAISKLADMMRYSLEGMEKDGNVSLEKEIAHIKNFIDIQQLRFDNKLNVSLKIKGNSCECWVMPLLLITFVENAFKHGKLNDAGTPILISITITQECMHFEITNKKATGKKEQAHGIGLDNVRNRLELAYPGQYELIINDTGDNFTVKLKLPCSHD